MRRIIYSLQLELDTLQPTQLIAPLGGLIAPRCLGTLDVCEVSVVDEMTMTPVELDRRWHAVIRELEDLAELRTIPGDIDPAGRERELLEELDELEYLAGVEYFRVRYGY